MSVRYLTNFELGDFIQAASDVPYQRVESALFQGVDLWIRRDDLLDPIISGNKAYKLLFNLLETRKRGADTLITCGGAWSNHIHATAAAGRRFGLKTIGIIRGQRPSQLSATLQDAQRFGMRLIFVSRDTYRRRHQPDFLNDLGLASPEFLFIPEGGANLGGAKGTKLLGQIISRTCTTSFDQIWLACGTGSTLAGLQLGLDGIPVVGVPVLKAENSIRQQAHQWQIVLEAERREITLCSGYHCGGYARYPDYLRAFQKQFERDTGIPLDPVYTAKLLYGLHRESLFGRIPAGSKILALHSGGLQARRGFNFCNLQHYNDGSLKVL